jgi:hypothetical protein
MERITVRAARNCKNCLGTGVATPLHALCGSPVCSCVTEQLRILTVAKGGEDYSIPVNARYSPGSPEYVKGGLDKV